MRSRMRDGGGEARWTYGLYHGTASACLPKRSCGRIARSLVARRSSTVYQGSSGHLSAGGDGQLRFRGDRGVRITYRFRYQQDWTGAQRRKRIKGAAGLRVDGGCFSTGDRKVQHKVTPAGRPCSIATRLDGHGHSASNRYITEYIIYSRRTDRYYSSCPGEREGDRTQQNTRLLSGDPTGTGDSVRVRGQLLDGRRRRG